MSGIDNNVDLVIETMINLKIFDRHAKHDRSMRFTKQFNQHFRKVSQRLNADPATDYMDTYEGLKCVVLNYLGQNKIHDELLYDICVMIYTLKMMIANPGWKPSDIDNTW